MRIDHDTSDAVVAFLLLRAGTLLDALGEAAEARRLDEYFADEPSDELDGRMRAARYDRTARELEELLARIVDKT